MEKKERKRKQNKKTRIKKIEQGWVETGTRN